MQYQDEEYDNYDDDGTDEEMAEEIATLRAEIAASTSAPQVQAGEQVKVTASATQDSGEGGPWVPGMTFAPDSTTLRVDMATVTLTADMTPDDKFRPTG